MRLTGSLAVVAGGLVLVAPARAQGPVPPGATPPPPPAAAQLRIALTARAGRERVVLTGEAFGVRGTLTPAVAGQAVRLRLQRDGHEVGVVDVPVGPTGAFARRLSSARGGRLAVLAEHVATRQQAAAAAPPLMLTAITPRVAPGGRGEAVRYLQRALARHGYVVGRRGTFDARTARAVLAFRKLTDRPRTLAADRSVFAGLERGEGAFRVRFRSHGRHVEADLRHQVLALIAPRGRVERIYPTSSGKPSTPTVLGHFRVYAQQPGTNAKGMVYPSYFIRGYAIHGYFDVPAFAASHGCLRVPVPDAIPIYHWVRVGMAVDVYAG